MRVMTKNEKIDMLYSIILMMIFLFALFICKVYNFYREWTSFFLFMGLILSVNFPSAIRRRKQYKKIEALRKILNLSIEEVRAIADIGRYDLTDWKWNRAYISQRKLYKLEDVLEKMYFKKFDREFVLDNKNQVKSTSLTNNSL
ncbi:hypothetical protein [Enterococcus camelliae]|uniref:Uncharacterized protein n=1 Tax=Enterococcus camelliae TaxID=453959 RepID=A0ABW5TLY5_9ENTE